MPDGLKDNDELGMLTRVSVIGRVRANGEDLRDPVPGRKGKKKDREDDVDDIDDEAEEAEELEEDDLEDETDDERAMDDDERADDEEKTKRVDGEDLKADAFLIVGDKEDTSTWKLPVKFSTKAKTKSHIANALARIDQLKGVSAEDKAAAKKKLEKLAKQHGIGEENKTDDQESGDRAKKKGRGGAEQADEYEDDEDEEDDDQQDESDDESDDDDEDEEDDRPARKKKRSLRTRGKKRAKRKPGSGQEAGQGDEDEESDESAGDGMEELEDGGERTYPIALSSEEPVDMWFGREILDHSPGSVKLSRAQGMPVLLNHDPNSQIGVVRKMKLGDDRKLRADIQFSKNPAAQEVERDVRDGIRQNISVGYRVNRYDVTEGRGGQPSEYRAMDWTPHEVSIVSVPADHTVGVGRSANGGKKLPVHISLKPPKGALEVTMSNTATAPNGAAEIVRLANQHGMSERAAEWIEKGLNVDQVKSAILDARSSKAHRQPAAETAINLNENEANQYSYARAIALAADQAEGKRGVGSFELEISQELEKQMPSTYKRMGGLFIPTSLRGAGLKDAYGASNTSVLSASQRSAVTNFLTRAGGSGSIDSQTANYIKEVVFTEYGGELINILRNTALVARMGARILTGLSSPVGFPRQTSDVAAVWTAENSGSNVGAGQVSTDLVTLVPKTLMAATAYSRQLLVQSSVDVEAMVRESIAASHALAWDLAAIHGTGSNNQPKGIYSQTGVLTEDFSTFTTPDMLNYGQLVDMENQVASANALLGSLGWLTTPSVAKAGKTKLRFPNASIPQGGEIWEGTILEGEMDGYVARATNQVSKTLGANGQVGGGTFHGLIFGNWSDLLVGQFGGAMELIVDPYSLKKQGLIEVASFQMADVAVRHAPSFCVGLNLNPSL